MREICISWLRCGGGRGRNRRRDLLPLRAFLKMPPGGTFEILRKSAQMANPTLRYPRSRDTTVMVLLLPHDRIKSEREESDYKQIRRRQEGNCCRTGHRRHCH